MDNQNQLNPQVSPPSEASIPNPSSSLDNLLDKQIYEEAVKATHSAARWAITLGVLNICLPPAYEYWYLYLTKTTGSPNAIKELISASVAGLAVGLFYIVLGLQLKKHDENVKEADKWLRILGIVTGLIVLASYIFTNPHSVGIFNLWVLYVIGKARRKVYYIEHPGKRRVVKTFMSDSTKIATISRISTFLGFFYGLLAVPLILWVNSGYVDFWAKTYHPPVNQAITLSLPVGAIVGIILLYIGHELKSSQSFHRTKSLMLAFVITLLALTPVLTGIFIIAIINYIFVIMAIVTVVRLHKSKTSNNTAIIV